MTLSVTKELRTYSISKRTLILFFHEVSWTIYYSHKDLGVIFSFDLKWSCHYEHIIAKALKILGLLRRQLSSSNCINTKKILYIFIVRSWLLYCSPLWRPHLMKDIILLERVQRRATKFIFNDYSSDYKSRLIKLGMLPLMCVYELADILFFY